MDLQKDRIGQAKGVKCRKKASINRLKWTLDPSFSNRSIGWNRGVILEKTVAPIVGSNPIKVPIKIRDGSFPSTEPLQDEK